MTSKTGRAEQTAAKKRNMNRNINRVITEATEERRRLDETLGMVVTPLVTLPETLNLLVDEKRLEDIPKVTSLTKSIREDLDVYTPIANKLKNDLDAAVALKPHGLDKMSSKYSKIFNATCGMQQLTAKVHDTAGKAYNQLVGIVDPALADD